MGVAQKTTFTTLETLKKFFGVSGDLMEYNERGKPLKRLFPDQPQISRPNTGGSEFMSQRFYLILILSQSFIRNVISEVNERRGMLHSKIFLKFLSILWINITKELYFSQKQLPRKTKPRLVIIGCAGYIF